MRKINIFKNKEAFHPVIMGVVILAIVAIIMGIMIMTYSNISGAVVTSTFDSKIDTFNDTDSYCNANNCTSNSLSTLALDDGTPVGLVVSNATVTAFVNGLDYNVTTSNNTIRIANRQGVANALLIDKPFYVTYTYEGDGTNSLRKIDTNVYKGFDLSSIAPIVLAAGLIISVVIGFAAMTLGRRE